MKRVSGRCCWFKVITNDERWAVTQQRTWETPQFTGTGTCTLLTLTFYQRDLYIVHTVDTALKSSSHYMFPLGPIASEETLEQWTPCLQMRVRECIQQQSKSFSIIIQGISNKCFLLDQHLHLFYCTMETFLVISPTCQDAADEQIIVAEQRKWFSD